MNESARKKFQAALELPGAERAALIDELVSNLDKPDTRIDELWAKEAEDRLQAFQTGKIDAIPADDVFSELGKS